MIAIQSMTMMGTAIAVPLCLMRAPRMSARLSPSRTTVRVTDAKAVTNGA